MTSDPGLELRIAYGLPVDGTIAEYFPNQADLPAYVEESAYLVGNDFGTASLQGPDEDGFYAVHIALPEATVEKLNRLASRDNRPVLGLYKDGDPVELIQVIHEISDKTLSWYGFKSRSEALTVLGLFDAVRR